MTQIYKVGTATVSNGSATVEGDDTGWATALVVGGLFTRNGLSVPIESVTGEDELTLALPWPGEDGTGAYAIMRENSAASSVVGLYDRLRQAMITLSLHSIHPDFVGTLAEIEALDLTPEDTEFVAARLEDGQPDEYYRWGGTDWVGPFPISKTGPAGVGEGGYGLPAGGTTGQVLAKASNDDGDSAWVDPPAGDVTTADIREKLAANRTYYVRDDGSNSNTGLVNSSGGALLTLQKAWDLVAALDLSIYSVTIKAVDGAYTGGISASAMPVGGSGITIEGNTGTPANVHLNMTSTNFLFSAPLPCPVSIRGFKQTFAGSSASAVRLDAPGTITVTNIELAGGSTGFAGAYRASAPGARIIVSTGQTITGGMSCFAQAVFGGIVQFFGIPVTLTGTPAFSWLTVSATAMGLVDLPGVTFSGSATGVRYGANTGGGINTGGGGESYLPGNANGSTTTPGWYR